MICPSHLLKNITHGVILFGLIAGINSHHIGKFNNKLHSQSQLQQKFGNVGRTSSHHTANVHKPFAKSASGPAPSFMPSKNYFAAKSNKYVSRVKSLARSPPVHSGHSKLKNSMISTKKDNYAPNGIFKQSTENRLDRHQIKNIQWFDPKLQRHISKPRPPKHFLNKYGLQKSYGEVINPPKYHSAVLNLSPNSHKSSLNLPTKTFSENTNIYNQNSFGNQVNYNPLLSSGGDKIRSVEKMFKDRTKQFYPTNQKRLTTRPVKDQVGHLQAKNLHGTSSVSLNFDGNNYGHTKHYQNGQEPVQRIKTVQHNGHVYTSAISNIGGNTYNAHSRNGNLKSPHFIVTKEYIHKPVMKVSKASGNSLTLAKGVRKGKPFETKHKDTDSVVPTNSEDMDQNRRYGSLEYIKHLKRNGHVKTSRTDIHKHINDQDDHSTDLKDSKSVLNESYVHSTSSPQSLTDPVEINIGVVEFHEVETIDEPKLTAKKQKVIENVVRSLSSPMVPGSDVP